MSSHALYTSLLRLPVLHILRAAGFHATRPAVLDTLVDLAARYLTLLAANTASHATLNHNDVTPTIMDIRMALQDVGALWPQVSVMEEQSRGEEDMRGMQAFIEWMEGDVNREMRRIAGLGKAEGEVLGVGATAENQDFLTGKFLIADPVAINESDSICPQRSRKSIARRAKNQDIKVQF